VSAAAHPRTLTCHTTRTLGSGLAVNHEAHPNEEEQDRTLKCSAGWARPRERGVATLCFPLNPPKAASAREDAHLPRGVHVHTAPLGVVPRFPPGEVKHVHAPLRLALALPLRVHLHAPPRLLAAPAHVRFRRYRFPAADLNSKAQLGLGFNKTNQQLVL
jgi:hypothetical protein